MSDLRPIGMFDSGLGGLTILKEVRRQLPFESILYFGDHSRLPYGSRPAAEIRLFAEQISRFLLQRGAKLIVVACNTASAASLSHLRRAFPHTPFVGMEPAVKPAAALSKSRAVGVIATQSTCQSEVFASAVQRFAQGVAVHTQACPGLVEQVEAGEFESEATRALLRRYLDPLLAKGIDSLVLACTHYSFLAPSIAQIVGADVTIIDPAPAVARQVSRVLRDNNRLRAADSPPTVQAFTTGEPSAWPALAARMIGEPLSFQHAKLDGPAGDEGRT